MSSNDVETARQISTWASCEPPFLFQSRLTNSKWKYSANSLFGMAAHIPSTHEELFDPIGRNCTPISTNSLAPSRTILPWCELWSSDCRLRCRILYLPLIYRSTPAYSWANGRSANFFGAELFQEKFSKDHRSQAAWDKFRQGILEWGGSRNELGALEEFLSRPASATTNRTDALLRSLSLPTVLWDV